MAGFSSKRYTNRQVVIKMKDIIFRLLDFINNHKTRDANYFIALKLLGDVYKIPDMNISALADSCFTSPAAVTRFCRRIGYKNFQEFKDFAKISVMDESPAFQSVQELENPEQTGEVLQKVLYEKIVGWLKASENIIDVEKVQGIMECIHHANKVSFYGTQLSQAMAQDFQFRLVRLGKFVSAYSDVQEQKADMDDLDENSVAIVASPSGRFILGNEELMTKLTKTKAKIILITHNQDAALLEKADIVYYLNGDSHDKTGFSSERFSLMYFFDFAIAYYQQLFYKKSEADMQ